MFERDGHARPGDRLGESRQAARRLRWRLRGAWQWPAFLVLTVVDAVVLALLPFYEPGPDGFVPALLIAGFANLMAIGVVGPLAGRLLRRRRPDLPRIVAADYAGTALVVAVAAGFAAGGLLHRPAAAAADAEHAAVLAGVHDYVLSQAPALRDGIALTDTIQLEDHLYRACVPTRDPDRWLCLIVSTDQRPAGVTRDSGQEPNSALRAPASG